MLWFVCGPFFLSLFCSDEQKKKKARFSRAFNAHELKKSSDITEQNAENNNIKHEKKIVCIF